MLLVLCQSGEGYLALGAEGNREKEVSQCRGVPGGAVARLDRLVEALPLGDTVGWKRRCGDG